MSISGDFRGWLWTVLCLGLAEWACAGEPLIRELPGPEGDPAIPCAVYEPHRTTEGGPGLVVHLYGSGGSHRYGHYNVGRSPYDKFRRLLAERGYWLVVPELGARHWMNETASAQLDSVIRDTRLRIAKLKAKRTETRLLALTSRCWRTF